ncbi:hypothetical protein MAP00_006631 [Monascus purpureus]|nr:hypothetical protein MAP00_006631 [Monascus purpureus]
MSRLMDFLKRPAFSVSRRGVPEANADAALSDKPDETHEPPQSSPLTEPSSLLSRPTVVDSLGNPDYPLSNSLLTPVKGSDKKKSTEPTSQGDDRERSSLSRSFSVSQRIKKDGKEVVISSDGEETESLHSLEDPENLFMNATDTRDSQNKMHDISTDKGMKLRSRRIKGMVDTNQPILPGISARKYKFTLDSLVTSAVDDREVEASVAELKATFEATTSQKHCDSLLNNDASGVGGRRRQLQKHLTSALDNDDGGTELQRLYDAVQRTEAFDEEKTWSFFDNSLGLPPPEFPRDTIAPGTYLAVLREPDSRQRALHSGIVNLALSRNLVPAELITWIFQSVSSEPRQDLRYTCCRVFRHVTADQVKSLIRPNDIDDLFRRLGAKPEALDLSKALVPDSPTQPNPSKDAHKRNSPLLSVLELLRDSAYLFANDTREHILNILFRLEADASLVGDSVVCPELEHAITSVLKSIPESSIESTVQRICMNAFGTVNDAVFQSRILKHILPTSDWIALFRCRLAVAFLIRDPAPLTESPEAVFDLKRIRNVLKDRRFNIKAHKGKRDVEYDYEELGAITTLLNIAINPESLKLSLTTKMDEDRFNEEVDKLADRIKRIFISIEDSGASHLRRTQAKEGLEALHYRIVYSLRTKPRPKKNLFGTYGRDDWQAMSRSSSFMEKYLTVSRSGADDDKPALIPENDGS